MKSCCHWCYCGTLCKGQWPKARLYQWWSPDYRTSFLVLYIRLSHFYHSEKNRKKFLLTQAFGDWNIMVFNSFENVLLGTVVKFVLYCFKFRCCVATSDSFGINGWGQEPIALSLRAWHTLHNEFHIFASTTYIMGRVKKEPLHLMRGLV